MPPETKTIRSENNQSSQIGSVGRIGRGVMGILFLLITFQVFIVSTQNMIFDILWSIAVFLFIAILYFIIHKLIESQRIVLNKFTAAVLANGIVGAVMGLGYFTQILSVFIGTTSYIGITLLISSYKKYTGCEVMSLPAILTKKHTSMPCIVFSPIDKWENAHSKD